MKSSWKLVELQYYIAGLFEGDGHIWIPSESTLLKKKTLPRWSITANIKDKKSLEFLKTQVGHGFIREKHDANAVVWTVGNREGLKVIIEWLGGKLYTPKVNKFNEMIKFLDNYYLGQFNTSERLLNKNLIDPTLNNAWLSGFADADSNFYIRTTGLDRDASSKKVRERITGRFSIDQRMVDADGNSYGEIMKLISSTLNLQLSNITRTHGTYYNVASLNNKSILAVIDYFEKYPLLSSKYLDYLCWKEVISIKGFNKTLTAEEKSNILTLKNQMNSQRSQFSWKHLPRIEPK